MKLLLLGLVLFCGMGASPCWKQHNPEPVIPVAVQYPAYTIVMQPVVAYPVYQAMVVQETRLMPVVENRLIYQPVGYNFCPAYQTQVNPWVRYNY